MDNKAGMIAEMLSWLTFIGSGITVFLSWLNIYGSAFGVIFTAITCFINWRVQAYRLKKAKETDLKDGKP